MNTLFFKQINELIIEADFEDDNITASIGEEGFPTADEILQIKGFVSEAIDESRKLRLERIKASFNQNRENKSKKMTSVQVGRSLQEMLGDIVKAMQSPEQVPNGLLIAFREQSANQAASEEDIKEIWESLYQLGLIDIDGKPEE